MLTLPMAEPTNNTAPTGGVINPIPRFTSMIMPNCTGSTPMPTITGIRIGVRIRINGAMSITVPNSSNITLMHIRIT
ncbi:hypothetical protein D3C84_881970 [compost metagenome]